MKMTKILVQDLKIGDTIMPPARELSLWMRKRLQEKNLPESALHLTITEIIEGASDKRGRWLIIRTNQTPEWNAGGKDLPFSFKARPETPWLTA
jgi:hypothetical protein